MKGVQTIELSEYIPRKFEINEIEYAIAKTLWHNYRTQVDVEFPSPKTGDKWQLTSKGWVGHIPVTPEFHLALLPKVPLSNLFGMLEYAYNLKSFRFLDGLINCQSLEEFYNYLAHVLAQGILNRCRKGFYRAYLTKTANLAYIRGRMDVRQAIQKPWDVKLKCDYEEQTADVEENQILSWTLLIIGRSGLCTERVLPKVRQAYHALQGLVTPQPCKPSDCIGRRYNRLNQDYQPLHALCRFFLEHTGPSHEIGDRAMLPFLVDMARLYELFVAEWLKNNPPQGFFLKQQHRVTIHPNRHFHIDLILCDVETGAVRYVLDTKYKAPEKVSDDDLHQMVSYATATKCQQAVLIYPKHLKQKLDIKIDNIRVRSLSFSLDGDLKQAGATFLKDLLSLS